MMKYTGILFFFILLLLPTTNSVAQTREYNAGADHDFRKADDELNKIYIGVLKIYNDDTVFIRKLKIAQKAWIIFRDAHLDSKYGETQDTYLPNNRLYSLCSAEELVDLIKIRIAQLKVWLNGYEDDDVCQGEEHSSVKDTDELARIKKNLKK